MCDITPDKLEVSDAQGNVAPLSLLCPAVSLWCQPLYFSWEGNRKVEQVNTHVCSKKTTLKQDVHAVVNNSKTPLGLQFLSRLTHIPI